MRRFVRAVIWRPRALKFDSGATNQMKKLKHGITNIGRSGCFFWGDRLAALVASDRDDDRGNAGCGHRGGDGRASDRADARHSCAPYNDRSHHLVLA